MRKNLLAIGLLATSLAVSAQSSVDVAYVGNKSTVYIGKEVLMYNGGNFILDSSEENTVQNNGNIIIDGDYKKGSYTGAAADGKEFVNVYNGVKDYGQVKILDTNGVATNARMTVQRTAASNNYFGASYAVSFPFRDSVPYLMTAFGLKESDFQGSCPIDAFCGNQRYAMTLTKWNNNKLHHDAVPTVSTFTAGDYYNLNLRKVSMQSVMKGIINYKGNPSPQTYTAIAKGVITAAGGETAFSNMTYNEWKDLRNPYNERYKTYMGDVSSISKVYAKNVYRFGNPYTSNLDLSAFDGTNAWLKILNNSTSGRTIKEATTDKLIRNFYISKRTETYDVNWSPLLASVTNNNGNYYKASFDGTTWTGNGEALIVRPTETFNLNFPSLDATPLGSRIIEVKVEFNDNHKTFEHKPSAQTTGSSLSRSSSARTSVSNAYNFVQAELFLVQDNKVLASPVYLVGTNYNTETGTKSTNTNGIYVYGVNGDQVAYDSKNDFNTFNSLSYVGKPLGIGFNDLVEGQSYEIRFNLYEGSIFNNVSSLQEGNFFVKDSVTGDVSVISPDKSLSFTAQGDMTKRFNIYWKEVPGVLATQESATLAKETYVYEYNTEHKVRFEKSNDKAKVEVFDLSGRLLSTVSNVNTSADYALGLIGGATYVVKVTYSNGDTRTLKTIKQK